MLVPLNVIAPLVETPAVVASKIPLLVPPAPSGTVPVKLKSPVPREIAPLLKLIPSDVPELRAEEVPFNVIVLVPVTLNVPAEREIPWEFVDEPAVVAVIEILPPLELKLATPLNPILPGPVPPAIFVPITLPLVAKAVPALIP